MQRDRAGSRGSTLGLWFLRLLAVTVVPVGEDTGLPEGSQVVGDHSVVPRPRRTAPVEVGARVVALRRVVEPGLLGKAPDGHEAMGVPGLAGPETVVT